MSAQNDGGPAFPVPTTFRPTDYAPCHTGMYWDGNGMSLRDWFAGQALAGIAGMAMCVRPDDWPDDRCSAYAYELADAMLAAREAKQ